MQYKFDAPRILWYNLPRTGGSLNSVNDLLTTKQLQEMLQVDRVTIYRMLDDGRLSGFKVGSQWRFPRREIERWLREQRVDAAEVVPSLPAEAQATATHDALPLSCVAAIQGIYAESLQVAAVVTDLRGMPMTPVSNSCAFCDMILSTPEGSRRCALDWRDTSHGHPHLCHANLLCTSMPVHLEGAPIAIAAACQFSTRPPGDNLEWQANLAQLAADLSIPARTLQAAAGSVRVLSEEELSRIPQILHLVSQTMTEIGQERLKLVGRLRHIAQVSQV